MTFIIVVNPKARTNLFWQCESHQSRAPSENKNVLFPEKNWGAMGVYSEWQTPKPYKAVETGMVSVSRCTVVTDQYDPSIGGAISDSV